jgi:hypothetical protein
MKKSRLVLSVGALGVAIVLAFMTGCNPSTDDRQAASLTNSTTGTSSDSASDSGTESSSPLTAALEDSNSEHGHKPGAHGGIMVSLGRDSYHIEAVVDTEGLIRLYTLGQDETRVIDIESQTLKGFVKADGDADSKSIDFEPQPQDGDGENRTSLFVGRLPTEFVGRKLEVTIPNIHIAGERFRLGFQSVQDTHEESMEMPEKVANDEERELYLTPGGRYTSADIKANGNMTASQKFKGIKSEHDMRPKVGDMLCPITSTKANPKFTWIIDGQPYEFCCPPCIDEFLVNAKSSIDPLAAPDTYIKK